MKSLLRRVIRARGRGDALAHIPGVTACAPGEVALTFGHGASRAHFSSDVNGLWWPSAPLSLVANDWPALSPGCSVRLLDLTDNFISHCPGA